MLSENDAATITSTLLIGEANFCQSFLFEIGISYASEGRPVFFFTPNELESLPAQFHGQRELSADALQFIKFVYPSTYEDLVAQLLQVHLFTKPPSLILVDNLDHFAVHSDATSQSMHAARLCSLLLRTAMLTSARHDRTVNLCAACQPRDDLDLSDVYGKYFDSLWTVSIEANPSTDEKQQILMKRSDDAAVIEFFRISDAVLMFGRIFEKCA